MRWTILGELGRIDDDDILRGNAADICKQKMKTADAIHLLRRTRIRRAKEPDATELANVIIETVNGYLHRREAVERETLKTALAIVADAFKCDEV